MSSLRLVGANPGVMLFDDAGERVAFCSVWQVDWSEHGAGTALVLWYRGVVRVLTETPDLGWWLAGGFVRWFPEVDGLSWPDPVVEHTPVAVSIDAAGSCSARGGDVEVSITEPLARRRIHADAFALDGEPHELSTVYIPCVQGSISIAGRTVDAQPQVTMGQIVSSSAFVAVAEVWSKSDNQPQ